MSSARARSRPTSSCATRRWCRRRPRSTSWRRRCPRRCRTRPRREPRSRARRRLRRQHLERAGRQYDQPDLYRLASNVQRQITIVNVTDPTRAAAAERRQCQPAAGRRELLVGVALAGDAAQQRAGGEPACSSRIVRFDAAHHRIGGRRPSTPPRRRQRARRSQAATRSCRCLPTATALHRAVHRDRLEMTGLAGRISVNPAIAHQPVHAQHLYDVAADADRRQHALGFHVLAADERQTSAIRRRPGSARPRSRSRARSRTICSPSSASRATPRRSRRSCSRARASSSTRCSRSSTRPRRSTSTPRCRT